MRLCAELLAAPQRFSKLTLVGLLLRPKVEFSVTTRAAFRKRVKVAEPQGGHWSFRRGASLVPTGRSAASDSVGPRSPQKHSAEQFNIACEFQVEGLRRLRRAEDRSEVPEGDEVGCRLDLILEVRQQV